MASVDETALRLATAMAKEALALARRRPEEVASKANAFDLVTSVDKEIEARLRGRIHEHFPDHAILGEEEGFDDGSPEWTWVLDPIDGTLNFASGLPLAACSIALLREDLVRVAALGDLATDTVYSARTGGGIQSDGPGLSAVPGEAGRGRLFVDFGPEAPQPELPSVLESFAEITPLAPRMIGSAAVALLAVAVGGGCFAGVGLRLWDVAAGILLVEESGRTVRRWSDEGEHVVHVLAGDVASVEAFEPAMARFRDLWRALESPRLHAAPGTGRG